MTMHPHDTPEAKAAHVKAQAEWYQERLEEIEHHYSFRGFLGEVWPILLVIAAIVVFAACVNR